jgi:hypothetical protein
MPNGQRDLGKERLWRELVQRWRRSDLTARAFCAEQGISEPSFYAWRKTINERDTEAGPTAKRHQGSSARRSACQADDVPAFVPVGVGAAGAASGAIEVVIGPGRIVRVPAGFDADMLRQLLKVLEEPSC